MSTHFCKRKIMLYTNINKPSRLLHTVFIGGDGNFRLCRNNKGGGEISDPSLFGDDSFEAVNGEYKDFCSVRGGAPDDTSVIKPPDLQLS